MNSGPMFPEPDYIPSDAGGGGKGKMIAAGLAVAIIIAIIAYMLWSSLSPSPTPSPSSSPNESPPPTWKPYCTFNASGTNKDNFNVASDSGIELFPIDLSVSEYNQQNAFDYDGSGNILTCKVNASTNSPEYAPSGPTTLGYTFPTITHSETLVPDDGTITKTDSVCTWNPKSNICDIPICSLGESYNNVLLSEQDKKQGIKQYLSQNELDAFISRLSCPGGYKYGQCNGPLTKCSDPGKQNNKINCLGNCSGSGASNILTKEACETAGHKWIYDPSNTQCKYELLDKPPIKIGNIQHISSGEYHGKYKMCDNPGDSVDLDSMIDTCSNTCYPNPNNDYTPFNTNEMPLSWTNKCGFTEITNKKFTSNTYHITPCANSAVLKGNVYYNICSSAQNCSYVKSDIENHVPSASPVSPPCQGGGDIFDVYNNCSAASCDNIFSHSATTGSTYGQCPNNKTYIPSSPGTESAISLPPASDCNPDSSSPFSIKDYYSKAAVGNCCVNKTCDDEYPNCPTGFSKRSPLPSPGSSENTLTLQDCCVLETCSKYVSGNNKCVEGTTRIAGSDNTYVLSTCCNGYIQITIKLKSNIKINKFMQISGQNDKTLTNVFPSYILKQLLKPSSSITLNSINPTSIDPSNDNLYFINNQTTFMELPTDKQTMDNAIIQLQSQQRSEITGMKTNNQYNFYILTSQKYDSKRVISFNISEAYTTVKNITDKISNADPNISKINASLTDCRSTKGVCDIIPRDPNADQVLNGDNSYCCMKSTCGNVLTQDQKDKLSGKSPAGSGFKACGGGTYFDGDSPWTPSSPITYINASNQCCVSGNITAVNPPGTIAGKDTIGSKFGSYVKNTTTKEIPLSASIEFQWVDGKFTPKDSNMNKKLATNYTCAFNNASIPEYGVSKHSNGKYYYKLTGCEDGDNTFCKIPNSHKQGDSDSDTYDASIYDLTGLMEKNEGSYISMYATAQGVSESKHEGNIMANYGGIVCTSDPYGTVNLEPCDEPYDYIKFSGCNTYFSEVGGYEFYTRSANSEDCLGLNEDSCKNDDYENLCIWNTSKNPAVCEPKPFPTYGGEVGKSCGDNLNSETTFSDAFWLKEGFQNQTYKDKSIFKKGDSTRIIQTPSPSPGSSGPPASPREVSRRTNYCGYKPKSQNDTDQFRSRVVDSTWMCKDKTCKENNNLNILLPKDQNLKSFTSYINGDPLIYNWSVNENDSTVSNAKKDFYDGDYILANGSFTVDDYRPLQGLPLTTFNLTDQYACVNKDNPSSRCARPTASPGVKPECSSNCSLTTISGIDDINSGDNVNDRISRFTEIQNIGGVDYNASQMEYVHNNIKYHNNYATMCGDNKYLRFFDFENDVNYQKCTPCRYQRDPYPLTPAAPPPNTYNEFYTTELNKLKPDEQSYINQHVYPKSSDPSKPVFLSSVISPSPSPNPSPGGNQNIILNETSPNKDDKNKMSNCSVNTSSTKRTEIPIGEYSTHFVPWWSESSATDLKITDTEFTALSKQLSPGSPPINIPTCDLHKDRCEDKNTSGDCIVNSSHSWTSPSSQHFNMCNWSGGKCMTNPDWMNDQTMCGHPCLSRIDAKPRECKFSDDCEIRDRYNFEAFSGIANSPVTMYCDSDGRNPILYGTASESKYESNAMQKDTAKYCNPGYYLIDVGGVDNKDGSNKSVYKCLSCDELNSYLVDSDSSGNTGASPMVKAFETYINACGTASQRIQYKSSGQWKKGSDGKCHKGAGNCTAFLWPSTAKKADPTSLTTHTDTDGKKYTSAPVLYTQDPIVADQYVKSQIGNNYNDCQNPDKGNQNMHSEYCKTYVSAMEKILGLTTRDYDTDHKFKGYNASLTISDIGINFGNCDYNTKPIMAKWDSKSSAISVNPGGMVASPSYNKGTTDLDKLILAGHLCPQRKYLAEGRPTEAPKELISMNDRYWPAKQTHKNNQGVPKEYTYCKPLLNINDKCPGRIEGRVACAVDGASEGKSGICGLKDPTDGSGDPLSYTSKNDFYCLGGLKEGSSCNHDVNYQCMEYPYIDEEGEIPKWYGARCARNWKLEGTCDGPNHRNGEDLNPDKPDKNCCTPTEACKEYHFCPT